MEELAENLEAKVRKWLGKQGYPMEMQVAQAFINKAFYVIQADVFEDEETGKFREIDVMASKFSYVDSGEQVSAISESHVSLSAKLQMEDHGYYSARRLINSTLTQDRF